MELCNQKQAPSKLITDVRLISEDTHNNKKSKFISKIKKDNKTDNKMFYKISFLKIVREMKRCR